MNRKTPPRFDDSTVRHYKADGILTVTRDDETDEHIIKSRGRDPCDQWTRRVPATRTDVDEGEKLWSIPDNWTHSYTLKPEHGHKRKSTTSRKPERMSLSASPTELTTSLTHGTALKRSE